MLAQVPDLPEVPIRLYASADELLTRAREGDVPALVFIDIQLNEGSSEPSGIDAVCRLRELDPSVQVVYMSGYDSYHTQVYRTSHTAYLRKPFSQADVEEAVRLVAAESVVRAELPLTVRAGGVERIISPRDIRYVESHLRTVRIHYGHEVVETYGKLGDYEAKLPARFVRSHQSFLVNLDYVADLSADEARLTTGEAVPVSRRCRAAVRAALFEHIRGER